MAAVDAGYGAASRSRARDGHHRATIGAIDRAIGLSVDGCAVPVEEDVAGGSSGADGGSDGEADTFSTLRAHRAST